MSTATQFWLSGLIGLLSSVVASAIFWLVLFRIRPSIKISPEIARTKNDDGSTTFRIKIVNKSRRAAVDLQASVYLDTLRKVPNGDVHMLRKLPLKSTPGFLLHGYNKKDTEARYARRLVIVDDLDATWLDEQRSSVVIRLFARDGTSGAFRQFEMTYRMKRNVVDGAFEWGDSFAIS